MEKYREIKWNKEIAIQRERSNTKEQRPITTYEQPVKNYRRNRQTTTKSNRYSEIHLLKIILGVAFGIVLAGLVTMAIKLMFVGAVLEQFQPSKQEKELSAYQAEMKLEHLKQEQEQVLQQRAIQAQRAENTARDTRQKQSFKSQYKKPAECYDIQNHETRVNCANHYMRAKAAFDNNMIGTN